MKIVRKHFDYLDVINVLEFCEFLSETEAEEAKDKLSAFFELLDSAGE